MIRRLLAFFALLTLAFVSAASAHEHGGMGHPMMAPAEATAQQHTATPATAAAAPHAVAWLASADVDICSETDVTGHSHAKLAGCTCPAACAGLFNAAATAPHFAAEFSAGTPSVAKRLSAMSAAPPTPPPRA